MAIALLPSPAGPLRPGTAPGLDLLAVAAGLKPLCIVLEESDAAATFAAREGLPHAVLARWSHREAPDWYAAARGSARARHPTLHVARDHETLRAAVALSARGVATPEEEAALLGYPLCCVRAHHRRAAALDALVADMTERAAGGDPARMARMIEAGAAPLPLTAEERARFAALAAAPSRWTGIVACESCATDPARPAGLLEAAYRALAAQAGT